MGKADSGHGERSEQPQVGRAPSSRLDPRVIF